MPVACPAAAAGEPDVDSREGLAWTLFCVLEAHVRPPLLLNRAEPGEDPPDRSRLAAAGLPMTGR
jgi:hypothetical protein